MKPADLIKCELCDQCPQSITFLIKDCLPNCPFESNNNDKVIRDNNQTSPNLKNGYAKRYSKNCTT